MKRSRETGADARHWEKVRLGREASALRKKARIIHPAGTQQVKAEYKARYMRTPYQTEMDLKK